MPPVPDMTTAEPRLAAAVTEFPGEATPRAALQDELIGSGRWTWKIVLGHVLADPRSDGLRLLAADYLEVMPPTKCLRCDGTGVEWHTPFPGAGVGQSRRCTICNGLKHSGPQQARDVVFIRSSVALARLQADARREADDVRKELAMAKPCGTCRTSQFGHGFFWAGRWVACPKCGGSGRNLPPGVRRTPGPPCPHIVQGCADCRDLHEAIRITRTDAYLQKAVQEYALDAAGYDRGFVGTITLDGARWPAKHAAITAAYPITRVTLTTWPTHVFHDDGTAGLVGCESRRWVPRGEPHDHSARGIVRTLAAMEWPGIDVVFPEPGVNTPHGVLADHMDEPEPPDLSDWENPDDYVLD